MPIIAVASGCCCENAIYGVSGRPATRHYPVASNVDSGALHGKYLNVRFQRAGAKVLYRAVFAKGVSMCVSKWLVSIILAAACCVSCSPIDEARALDGEWVWKSLNGAGFADPASAWAEIDGGRLTIHLDGKVIFVFTFTLDSLATPKAMDLVDVTDNHEPRRLLAIYDLKGDVLRICLAGGEHEPRPREFTSDRTTGRAVMTLTRKSASARYKNSAH